MKRERVLAVGLSPALSRVVRLPSLVPGSVIRAQGYLEAAAGKAANGARVAAQLGADPVLLSPIGDETLESYRQMALDDGIALEAVVYRGRTRQAVTLIDMERAEAGLEAATELIIGESEPVPSDVSEELLDRGITLMKESDLSLIAGSRLDKVAVEVLTDIASAAVSRGVPLFLDIRGEDLIRVLESAGSSDPSTDAPVVVKINGSEFCDTFGFSAASEEHLKKTGERFGCSFAVTRGGEPVLFYSLHERRSGEAAVSAASPMNPIGSGDTFLAALALRLCRGYGFMEAVSFAAEKASLNTRFLKPGTITAP